MSDQLKDLRDYSRQFAGIGSQPHLQIILGEDKKSLDMGLLGLSAQLRIAEALEKQTAVLERLHPEPQQATVVAPTGHTVHANWVKGSPAVSMELKFNTPEIAESFFKDLTAHLQQAVDDANQQEGRQSND